MDTKKITTGHTVTVECIGKLENGSIFTDSAEDGPIEFEVGKFDVIQGLNNAVIGMAVNEEKKVLIKPADAFGDYNDDLLISIPLEKLPENAQKGMQLKSDDENGEEVIWNVRDIQKDKDEAILDGNHILAGQKLEFQIKVIMIK